MLARYWEKLKTIVAIDEANAQLSRIGEALVLPIHCKEQEDCAIDHDRDPRHIHKML